MHITCIRISSVQYRVPIWQIIEKRQSGFLQVVYASDCSVRGHADEGFGKSVAWDDPMLSGHDYTILNCEKGKPLSNWQSLTGKGITKVIDKTNPDSILLTGFNYKYDLIAFIIALHRRIPIWLRCETQDEARNRSKFKSFFRSVFYRLIYKRITKFFYIGELNKSHYLNGVPTYKLKPALYGTIDRFCNMSLNDKEEMAMKARKEANAPSESLLVGFAGKLISKKNPEILFQMIEFLPVKLRKKIFLYFIGSGPLEENLIKMSQLILYKYGIRTHFAGFVNQSQIAPHYMALDILVLPSIKMGETWGLVVNEALQAGCGVVVSDMVGCSANFKHLSRFRIFKAGDAQELSTHIENLAQFPRSYDWSQENLKPYTVEATATALLTVSQRESFA